MEKLNQIKTLTCFGVSEDGFSFLHNINVNNIIPGPDSDSWERKANHIIESPHLISSSEMSQVHKISTRVSTLVLKSRKLRHFFSYSKSSSNYNNFRVKLSNKSLI